MEGKGGTKGWVDGIAVSGMLPWVVVGLGSSLVLFCFFSHLWRQLPSRAELVEHKIGNSSLMVLLRAVSGVLIALIGITCVYMLVSISQSVSQSVGSNATLHYCKLNCALKP